MKLPTGKNMTSEHDLNDLLNYIREINVSSDGGFALTESLDHWAGYDIYTREQLGDYLDDCVQKERDEGNLIDGDDYYRECIMGMDGQL